MSEYRQCECPYHDDGDGFIGGGDCPNEGRIKTARYGWLCAECYDQLEAAWHYVLEHRDELDRLLMGSVSGPVALHAHCSVEVVRY